MDTRGSNTGVRLQELNTIRRFVAYGPGDMPSVDVLVAAGDGSESAWVSGGSRMQTQHEDNSWTYTVQHSLHGHLCVDNFSEDRVRRVSVTQDLRGANSRRHAPARG